LSRYRSSEQGHQRKLRHSPSFLPQYLFRPSVPDDCNPVKGNCRFIPFFVSIGKRRVPNVFNLCQGHSLNVSRTSSVNERQDVVVCSFTFVPEDLVENTLQRMHELVPTEFISGLGQDKVYACTGNSATHLFRTKQDQNNQ